MTTSVRFCLSNDPLKWDFITFKMIIINIRNALLTQTLSMTLRLRAKVLLHVWSYDFYDYNVIHWITATSYDKSQGSTENSFESLQKASRWTKSVSNRVFLRHKSRLPIFYIILQTLRPNTFHLILWCIWSKCVRYLDYFSSSHLLWNIVLLHLHLVHAAFL